jgi:hypothetical protein
MSFINIFLSNYFLRQVGMIADSKQGEWVSESVRKGWEYETKMMISTNTPALSRVSPSRRTNRIISRFLQKKAFIHNFVRLHIYQRSTGVYEE